MGKKILLIAYHFPPSTEVGGLRVANLARHLPKFGWLPQVLTLRDDYLSKTDHGKLRHVGSVRIWKTGRMPTLSPLYMRTKMMLKLLGLGSRKPGNDAVGHSSRKGGDETVLGRMRRYILSFWSLPDEQRSWVLPAVLRAVSVVKREQIDCILTSCPPYSVHLVGLLTKLLTGVRWVADFRDPWMTGGCKTLFATCDMSLRIERLLERTIVRNADLVVANTDRLCEAFRNAYSSSMPKTHFACVTNGFDKEFFADFDSIEPDRIFTITYTGALYFGRTPEPIFQALHELIEERRIDHQSVRLQLVGHCQQLNGRPIQEVIQQYSLANVVRVLEPVDYRRAIEMIKRSHVALLLAPSQPYQIPAKAYDYIGVGTKILALAEDGATSDLIRATDTGGVFEEKDVPGVKEYIIKAMKTGNDQPIEGMKRTVAGYEIQAIVKNLALHLDCILVNGKTA